MFKHDFTGVNEKMEFTPIPEGDYELQIIKVKEGITKNKDPMVNVTCKVLAGAFAGRQVFHNVTFLPKDHQAAGMAKHFLHVIGQDFDGRVDVNPDNWLDETFQAHVKISEYNGKTRNEIDEVYDKPSSNGSDIKDVPF